ncbi:MAG TPA: CopG family transcriptional regulator [Streptosporangiaceae bacterium]|nr:CopG family transcriptional regulator [Streptosporangiaceae bacterium]
MRTTVTLDADVAARLKETARARGVSFKEALNSAIRAGLAAGRAAQPYRTPSRSLGLRPGLDLDKALHLADEIEDTEIMRKLDLRK